MRFELIPYGNPVRFYGEDRPEGLYPLFVQNIVIDASVKPDHIPCMQFKDGMYSDRFGSTEYIEDTEGPVARCVTSVELELIFEQYDVHSIEYKEGWAFKGSTELFATFIDETMEGKSKATIEGNTGMRQIFKLRANSSYGKLGTSTRFASMKPVKRDGRKETFDRQKLMRGLVTATVKRDVPMSTLTGLIDDIESELRDGQTLEVSSEDLGSMVLKRLISVDKVAYVRFASVYRDFKDVDEFSEELRSLND